MTPTPMLAKAIERFVEVVRELGLEIYARRVEERPLAIGPIAEARFELHQLAGYVRRGVMPGQGPGREAAHRRAVRCEIAALAAMEINAAVEDLRSDADAFEVDMRAQMALDLLAWPELPSAGVGPLSVTWTATAGEWRDGEPHGAARVCMWMGNLVGEEGREAGIVYERAEGSDPPFGWEAWEPRRGGDRRIGLGFAKTIEAGEAVCAKALMTWCTEQRANR